MTSRERFHATFNYQPVDRGVFTMPWQGFPETLERWRREGCPEDGLERYPCDHWHWLIDWFMPNPPFQEQIVGEDERHVLFINHEGILMRELRDNRKGSMPQFVRFPVETREDFRKFAAERLQPDHAARIGADWREQLKTLEASQGVVWVIADRWGGFFGGPRNLTGVEALCTLFYTAPAFIEEMMDTFADFLIAMMGPILDHIEIDAFGFWEDMAYNTGPIIGPDLVRRYMLPRYRRVAEYLRGRGVRWISLDSDGRVDLLVPIWLDAGINVLYPFEVAAGGDVVAMRKEYGRELRMYMGIDKRALAQGPAAIDAEIARVRPLLEEGGYVANLDHVVPPDVSYANFQYYMRRMAETLGVPLEV